jgi:serine/threonine protein kinase
MSKCKQCGIELEADVRYCPNCATKVDAPPQPAAAGAFTGTISGVATMVAQEADSSIDLEPGKEVHGRYTIERKLGQGAMGVVYLANDKLAARRVALKLINPALINSASARERFLREGLIARDIRHKNVVAVYDVGEAEGQFYLVMEYLSGETLRNWLHRVIQAGYDVHFPTAEKIIWNILEGLEAAHAAGVVHRDVKPENIMLTGNLESGDYSLKILDFGIARAIVNSSSVVTTTTSTGTALYMAPEQKTAADTVGPPADLYAVTAIFYELLLGVAPGGRWEPLSRERGDLPAGIDAVIEKGLSSRPRSRYQNAQEYQRALYELRNAPVPTPAPTPKPFVPPVPPAPSPFAANKKRWIIIGFAVFLGLGIIGAIVDKYNTEQMNPPQPQSQPQPQPQPQPEPQPPPQPQPPPIPPVVPSYTNLQSTWYDELTGAGIALLHVVIQQRGNSISGPILDANGIQWGTISGRVNGNAFEYNYYSSFGNGWGRGTLDPDGNHLQVLVNGVERHTFHRNHLPPY